MSWEMLLAGSLSATIYLLPTLIAWHRHAHNTAAIAILNVLLGWTLVVWFGASVWALTDRLDGP